MTTHKAPNPGKGWRLLEVGEIVRVGDECRLVDLEHDSWERVWGTGYRVTKEDVRNGWRYRRRIESEPVKEFNWKSLALRMYKAKANREANRIYSAAVKPGRK
jgi:hypothetical protein